MNSKEEAFKEAMDYIEPWIDNLPEDTESYAIPNLFEDWKPRSDGRFYLKDLKALILI